MRLDEASTDARRQCVLVVDDESDITESLKDLVEASLDVDVLTAASGAEALEILERHAVDLIVTDFRMPGMTGLELLQRARKVAPGIPRILVTAYPDLDLAVKAINDEAIANFIVKPFDPESVLETIFALLFARRSEELRTKSFARAMAALRRELHRRV